MKKIFLILLASLFFIACSDSSSTTEHCTTNDECTDSTKPICKSGVCVAEEVQPECTTNDECTDDAKPICKNNVCVAEEVQTGCSSDEDCTDPIKFLCQEQTCVDPGADFVPEDYTVVTGSSDGSYTEEELDALTSGVDYGFLRNVGKKEKEYAFGTNFNANSENVLRVPIPNPSAGVRYAYSIEFRDSKYLLPEGKKKKTELQTKNDEVEASTPEFADYILNCVTADEFKKEGELIIRVEFIHHAAYELFKRNTITWTPVGPDGKSSGEANFIPNIGFLYGSYPFMSPNYHGDNPEADWEGTETMGGISEFFHPQITYTFTTTNELTNGSTASATKAYRSNYKGCSEGKDLDIPAMTFFPLETPLDLDKNHIDLAWTNPNDIDIYEIRISWKESHPNPNIAPKHGEIVLQRRYNFNEETGKLTYGEEPEGTIVGGEWSPKKDFLEVTVY